MRTSLLLLLISCSTSHSVPEADAHPPTAAPDLNSAGGDAPGVDSAGVDSAADTASEPDDSAHTIHVLVRARLPGHAELVELRVEDGLITELGASVDPTDATLTDAGGRTLSPGFIDSHVHLAYLPQADAMARGGIVAAVDLAAPLSWLEELPEALEVLPSGPMVTAPAGYPTTSWGRDGYGLECASAEEAVAAVDTLVAAGARVIKVPLAGGPEHSDATLAAIAERTHHHGLRLGVHALDDEGAARAAAAGADLLVHVPTAPLSDPTVAAWAGGAVVPTLAAFGSSAAAVDNLRRLEEAGATVLYGTDFGNSRSAGIAVSELRAMESAGLSPAEVVAAATRVPADFWGLHRLGRVEVGARGPFLLTESDPAEDLSTLAEVTLWPGG